MIRRSFLIGAAALMVSRPRLEKVMEPEGEVHAQYTGEYDASRTPDILRQAGFSVSDCHQYHGSYDVAKGWTHRSWVQ